MLALTFDRCLPCPWPYIRCQVLLWLACFVARHSRWSASCCNFYTNAMRRNLFVSDKPFSIPPVKIVSEIAGAVKKIFSIEGERDE